MPERRLAVVTGASSGIGAATALALGAEGWRVVGVARGREALEAVAGRVREAGGEAVVEPLDAGDAAAVLAMAERVRSAWGVPEVVVNCAGAGRFLYVEETPPSEAAAMMRAPYLAAFHLTHAFMEAMIRRGSGHFVHVGSAASRLPIPGATGYVAARWALRGFNEALNQDLSGTGVRSSHVVFGKVASPYFDHNAGSGERLPPVSRLIPDLSPEACAEVILRVLRRPRAEVVEPFLYRVFYGLDRLSPRLTRWVARLGAKPRPE